MSRSSSLTDIENLFSTASGSAAASLEFVDQCLARSYCFTNDRQAVEDVQRALGYRPIECYVKVVRKERQPLLKLYVIVFMDACELLVVFSLIF